jgi:hypothetical protein
VFFQNTEQCVLQKIVSLLTVRVVQVAKSRREVERNEEQEKTALARQGTDTITNWNVKTLLDLAQDRMNSRVLPLLENINFVF